MFGCTDMLRGSGRCVRQSGGRRGRHALGLSRLLAEQDPGGLVRSALVRALGRGGLPRVLSSSGRVRHRTQPCAAAAVRLGPYWAERLTLVHNGNLFAGDPGSLPPSHPIGFE